MSRFEEDVATMSTDELIAQLKIMQAIASPKHRRAERVTHEHASLDEPWDAFLANGGPWWQNVGVFPPETENNGESWWDSFLYTVGFMPDLELWAPTASIEGRQAGHNLTGFYVNRIAVGIHAGLIVPGDDVRMLIGVAGHEGEDDVESVWWVGEPEPARYRQANMSPARFVVPILWSSPLGWHLDEAEYAGTGGEQ
jgi:hypothetical protein